MPQNVRCNVGQFSPTAGCVEIRADLLQRGNAVFLYEDTLTLTPLHLLSQRFDQLTTHWYCLGFTILCMGSLDGKSFALQINIGLLESQGLRPHPSELLHVLLEPIHGQQFY